MFLVVYQVASGGAWCVRAAPHDDHGAGQLPDGLNWRRISEHALVGEATLLSSLGDSP